MIRKMLEQENIYWKFLYARSLFIYIKFQYKKVEM